MIVMKFGGTSVGVPEHFAAALKIVRAALPRDPVVVVSADATPGQVDRLIAWGAHSYLTKPLNVKHFIKLIEQLLSEKEI